jgi:putative sporulation protein YtaF
LSREIKFSLFNFNFILKLYAAPEDSDADLSKNISPAEAASIAVALSLDGIAVGLGAALGGVNWLAVIIFSIVTDMLAIMFGRYIGEKAASKFKFNLSWLGGIILIALAVSKLL